MPGRRRKPSKAADDGAYTCPTCGETIIIPLDRSSGLRQEYGEDCPVCCHPNLIHVEFSDDGAPRVWAESD